MTAVVAVDLSKVLEGVPRGKWVAISSDMGRALASSDDVETVIKRANALGENEPVIMRVPDPAVALIL